MLSVVETFESIQGEGQNTGINTFFVRLYGCNLACSFCDEPKHTQKNLIDKMSVDDIIDQARTKWICITGGEPTLHDLNPMIMELQDAGYKVQVETNGYNLSMCNAADLVTVSPKGKVIPQGMWTEMKLIIPAQQHLVEEASMSYKQIYLQPENYEHKVNFVNVKLCLDLLKIYPEMGISVQLHKLIGVE